MRELEKKCKHMLIRGIKIVQRAVAKVIMNVASSGEKC